jgi:uncharacterized OsmC-like protein
MTPLLEYSVSALRIADNESRATCKKAEIVLDTALNGRPDAFNPAELFLASIAACMLKGIERVSPMLNFEFRAVAIKLHGVRQDKPPRMVRIDYSIVVETDESEHRLKLLHENVRKFGTIFNTVAAACTLAGTMTRSGPPAMPGNV